LPVREEMQLRNCLLTMMLLGTAAYDDGVVDVTEILAVMAAWGACP